MPLPYKDVLARYDRARAFGETRTLPEYAQHLNDIYDTQDFSEGLRDGPWTRFSTRADQVIQESPVGALFGALGEGAGAMFGHEEAGRSVGEGLPRALLQSLPLYLAGPEAGIPATALALGGTGLAFGSQTYADTGSAKNAVLSAATAAALPAVGKFAGELGAQAFGAPIRRGLITAEGEAAGLGGAGKAFRGVLDMTPTQRAAQFGASQLAQGALQEASGYAQQKTLDPAAPYDWLSPEFLIGQIPFTVHDAIRVSGAPKVTAEQASRLVEPVKKKTSVPVEPIVPPRPSTAEEQATVDAVNTNYIKIANDPSVLAEEKSKALAAAMASVLEPKKVEAVKGVEEAAATTAPTPEVTLSGKAEKQANGNWKVRVDAHDSGEVVGDIQGSTVFVNGVEGVHDPVTGQTTFKVRPDQIAPAKYPIAPEPNVGPELQARAPGVLPTTPGERVPEGSALQSYESPELQGQPVDLTPTEVNIARDMGVSERTLWTLTNKIPKSANLVLDMFQGPIQEDAQGQVLRVGNTDVSREGWMGETRFLKTTQVPKELLPAFREAYPEAFDVKGQVNPTALVKGLRERPMVEVKKLGEGYTSEEKKILAARIHDLDTRIPNWKYLNEQELAALHVRDRELISSALDDQQRIENEPEVTASSKYSFLGPKSDQDMPGYVEGLVRAKMPDSKRFEELADKVDLTDAEIREFQRLQKNPESYYTGPHFGSEDTNVLAFFRGYEETLPDGRKAFHVIEVQSDWGQTLKKELDEPRLTTENRVALKEAGYTVTETNGILDPQGNKVLAKDLPKNLRRASSPSHPLLASYETLALKAAVDHARSIGADAIILSDAETAMMTEGHDKAARVGLELTPKNVELAKKYLREGVPQDINKVFVEDIVEGIATDLHAADAKRYAKAGFELTKPTVSQSEGMRLHYDRTLPDALAKLTGVKGERVGVEGVHKGALRATDAGLAGEIGPDIVREKPEGSPVFREPTGAPKSSITGRLFSLEKLKGGLSLDDTLSLKEAVQRYEQAKVKEEQARAKTQVKPESAEEWRTVVPDETAKPKVEAELSRGATPTQAAESARLTTQTPEVERAMKTLAELTEQAQKIEQTQEQHKVVAEDTQGNEQHKYGPALKDEFGNRRQWRNEADAQRFIDSSEDLDKGNLRVRSSGRGTYYIAPIENLKTSLEAPRTSEGSTLENVVQNEQMGREREPSGHVDPSSMPRVALDNLLDTMDSMEQAPQNLARKLQEAGMTLDDWTKVKGDIEKGEIDQADPEHLRVVGKMFLENMRKPSVTALGSTIKGDPEVVARMNLPEGAMGLVKWIESLKIPVVSDLIGGHKLFPQELAKLNIVHEGPGWVPGMFMFDGSTNSLLMGALPTRATEIEVARAVSHEIAHHMLREMSSRNDPAAKQFRADAQKILETLRNGDLPKKVKTFLNTALKEDYYGKFARQEKGFEDFEDVMEKSVGAELTSQYSDIVYGLLNIDEMHAQMFSKHAFIAYMDSTKAPKDVGVKSVMNWFGKVWARLMQRPESDATAFEALLKSYDNYLTGGQLRRTYNGMDLIRDMLVREKGVRPEALASRMHTVDRTFTRGDLFSSIYGFEREGDMGLLPATSQFPERAKMAAVKDEQGRIVEAGIHPIAHNQIEARGGKGVEEGFVTNRGRFITREEAAQMGGRDGLLDSNDLVSIPRPIDQTLRTMLVSGATKDVFRATMNLLPDQVPVHQDLWHRMQQDVDIAKELYKEAMNGKIRLEVPEGAEAKLKLAQVKLNSMKRALDKQALALERQADLKNFTWEGLRSASGSERVLNMPTPRPQSEPPEMDLAQRLVGLRPAGTRLDETGKVKTETSAKELEGVDQPTWYEKNLMNVQHLAAIHPEVQTVVSHTFDQQAAMKELMHNLKVARFTNPATGQFDQGMVENLRRVAKDPKRKDAYNAIHLLIAEKEKSGAQWSLTDKDFQGLMSGLDPNQKKDVLTQVRQDSLQHSYFVNTVMREKFGEMNHLNTSKVIASLDGLLPEQAKKLSGDLYEALGMMRDPQQAQVGAGLLQQVSSQMTPPTFLAALKHANASIMDFQSFLDVAKKNYSWISEQRYDKWHMRMVGPQGEKFYVGKNTKEELVKIREQQEAKGYKFSYFEPKADANAPAGGVKEDIFNKLKEMDTLMITRAQDALSGRPDSAELIERVLPLLNRAEQVESSMKAFTPLPMTRSLVEGREHIDLLQNREEFYKRANNWFNHKLVRAHADLDFLEPALAGNRVLKNLMEQHVQNYLTPDNPYATKFNEMVFYQRMGLNFGNAALEAVQSLGTGMQALIAETGSVTDAAALTAWANKELFHHRTTGKWSSPEIELFMKAAEQRGDIAPVLYNDMHDELSSNMMSVSAKLGEPVKKTADVLKTMVHKVGGFFQKYNNKIGMLAAYKLALDQLPQGTPKDFENAYAFARDVKNKGTFTGGKAQRSVGLWGIKTRAVPQLMSSLQTYVAGWFGQMAKDFKVGFKGAGQATEQQRAGSRKAFAYGLAAQAVLAGGLGLPGIGQGIALLNQATGLDLKGWLRQNLANLFDEDQDSGGLLTNLALRGAVQAFSPIDPSNRSAIAVPYVGVDPYKGFSVAALAGAPGSSVADLAQGVMSAAHGDLVGMQKLLPSALKGVATLAQGNGDVRDSRGALLQTLSPVEQWMTALGLPSSRIQRARDVADTLKKQEAQAQREKETQVDALAKLLRTGNTTEVQRQMLELKKTDPTVDLRSLARSISNRVVAQTVPYDARRDVNPAADISGLQNRLPSTEMLRRQVSNQALQSLGFVPRFDPLGDQRAATLDALLNADPYLTRSAAMQTVRGTRGVRRSFDPAWTQGFQ